MSTRWVNITTNLSARTWVNPDWVLFLIALIQSWGLLLIACTKGSLSQSRTVDNSTSVLRFA